MDVLDGADVYAVELKLLEKGGVLNNASNKLVYDPDPSWTKLGTASVPYFIKDDGNDGGILWTGSTASYTFDLSVDASTPLDVYDLEFAVALSSGGEPTRYEDEHFYLHVVDAVPEPASWVMFSGLGVCLVWCWRRRKQVSGRGLVEAQGISGEFPGATPGGSFFRW